MTIENMIKNIDESLNKKIEKYLDEKTLNQYKEYRSHYWSNLKTNFIEMTPHFAIGNIAIYYSQEYSNSLFNNPEINTLTGIAAGYAGLFTYLGHQFIKNRDEYWGKEKINKFVNFASTFVAADWVTDWFSYTPLLVLSNETLQRTYNVSSGLSGSISSAIAMFPYIFAISATHPITEKLTEITNSKIKENSSNITNLGVNLFSNADKYLAMFQYALN